MNADETDCSTQLGCRVASFCCFCWSPSELAASAALFLHLYSQSSFCTRVRFVALKPVVRFEDVLKNDFCCVCKMF